MSRLSPLLRRRVEQRGQGICEYCRSSMDYTGHAFTVDHILPTARGGTDDFNNLCFCCFWCNTYKNSRTQALDGRTGRIVPLFNPRTDIWGDHFRWSPTSSRVLGKTAIGRVTIQVLRLNRTNLVRARTIWARHGLHPPE